MGWLAAVLAPNPRQVIIRSPDPVAQVLGLVSGAVGDDTITFGAT
jgi:hypothetical protein